ncbi:MAG: nitroreductase family protein [Myxococcales bacterium]|nr:nitroreductase family protein [Myxococcales bacterium]
MASEDRYPFVPYTPPRIPSDEALRRGRAFYALMDARRSVRHFSDEPVPREAIELAIRTASTAPSGAHRQPWRFVVVDDPAIKHRIRVAAEAEERQSYEGGRMSDEWREALAPIGTDWRKPYLETVPYLVVVFEEIHGHFPDGRPRKNYYVRESVGLACGLFIAALHQMGLSTLTHTPSPMGFLREILGRPKHERPFILFPVGYAAADARVPELERKPLHDVMLWNPTSEPDASGEPGEPSTPSEASEGGADEPAIE